METRCFVTPVGLWKRQAVRHRYRKHIVDLAIKDRTPSMCERGDYVQAGCMMSYSANDADSFTFIERAVAGGAVVHAFAQGKIIFFR